MSIEQASDILDLDRFAVRRCSGKRKDGQPCENPVSKLSCEGARGLLPFILDDRAYAVTTKQRLEELAKYLLCKRWHQDQSSTLVRRWQEKVSAHNDQTAIILRRSRETQHSRRTSHSTPPEVPRGQQIPATTHNHARSTPSNNTRAQHPDRTPHRPRSDGQDRSATSRPLNVQPLARPHTREYTRLLSTITNSNLTAAEKLSMIEATLSIMDSSPSHDNIDDVEDEDEDGISQNEELSAAELESAETQRERQHLPRQDEQVVRMRSHDHRTTRSSEHPNSGVPVPTSTSALASSSITASQTRTNFTTFSSLDVPYRESHEECCVCQESYDEGEELWQCTRCDNRTHADCFREWALSRELDATCVYCRVPVL